MSVAPRDGLSLSLLSGIDVWIVPPPESGAVARRLSDVRPGPKGTIVRISGVETPAEAHEIVGRRLIGRGEELNVIEGSDALVGYEVHDEERGVIGTVVEVIETGANDVLVVEDGPFGQVLVPVIDDVMGPVDDGAHTVRVRLLEGLIEDES